MCTPHVINQLLPICMKAAELLYQVQIKGTQSFCLTRMHLNHHLPRREGSLFITSQQHSSPRGDNTVIPEVMWKTAMRLLASKPTIMSTIYGECDVELGAALGPVLITFSIEPLFAASCGASAIRGLFPRCHCLLFHLYQGRQRVHFCWVGTYVGVKAWWVAHISLWKWLRMAVDVAQVPRANFYPSGPSQQPRSRSYSALSSYSFWSSQEEGEVQLAKRALASDVQHTLKNSQGSSTSFSRSQIEATSPRYSPPSFGATNIISAWLRQLSLSSTPLHLREATPYPNCSNLPLSKPNDQAIDEAGPISVPNKSDCHSHSHYNPPSPAHHRQPSLCSRLSLPSLRRHWNRHDDMPSPTVADHKIQFRFKTWISSLWSRWLSYKWRPVKICLHQMDKAM